MGAQDPASDCVLILCSGKTVDAATSYEDEEVYEKQSPFAQRVDTADAPGPTPGDPGLDRPGSGCLARAGAKSAFVIMPSWGANESGSDVSGARPSPGAATLNESRHCKNLEAHAYTRIAAPGDGRTPPLTSSARGYGFLTLVRTFSHSKSVGGVAGNLSILPPLTERTVAGTTQR